MKKILLLPIIFAISTLTSCKHQEAEPSVVAAQGNAQGQFRGYDKINTFFKENIYNTSDKYFSILHNVRLRPDEVSSILGTYQGFGAKNSFKNAHPNGVNMFLWQSVFENLAARLGGACYVPEELPEGESPPPIESYNPEFEKIILKFCKEKSESSAHELWTYLIGYESDHEFKEIWPEYIAITRNSESEYATDFLYLSFLNPHFLLER